MAGPRSLSGRKPSMTTVREVDLGRPAFKADPYPFYARLRAERRCVPWRWRTGGAPGW